MFRFADVGQPLQGKYEVPHREVPQPIPVAPWRDLTEEAARSAVLAGDSLCVTGPPGSSKSFWARELVKQWQQEKNKQKNACITRNNCYSFSEALSIMVP